METPTPTLAMYGPSETARRAMSEESQELTGLLRAHRDGDAAAFERLVEIVYPHLKRIAGRQLARARPGQTLDTTALVNEAYLKLIDHTQRHWQDRSHFFAVTARAMRQILIDYARQRQARKRGGDRPKVSFDEVEVLPEDVLVLSEKQTHVLLALDEALQRLEHTDARRGRVVEYRFFGRMSIEDTADALGVSRNTVKRDWNLAQVWLYREMRRILLDQGSLDPLS